MNRQRPPTSINLARAACIAVTLAAAVPLGAVGQHSVDDLAVLVGCWEGGMGPVQMREQWSAGDGGAMLGTTRFFRDGALVGFEFARIIQTDSAVVLWPYPGGERSPRGFPLVEVSDELVFENPEHDFPVRIIYHVVDADRLAPRIEGSDGDGRGWNLQRATCPGG